MNVGKTLFAQLTLRESLRDIEVCLTANQNKLFHMGRKGVPARSTLAMHLILRARDLYARDPLDIGLDSTVYALVSITIEAGAFYVMDRGYVDFARLYKMHQAGAFFVTRAKRNMNARRVYSTATDRASGIICDQLIAMNGNYVAKDYPEHL